MKERIRLRIKELVDENDISIYKIANTPAEQRRLNRQISEGCEVTLPTVIDIINYFPTLSTEWLLRGEGEKYKTDFPCDTDTEEVEDLRIELTKVHAERDELRKVIEELKTEVIELRAINRYQEKRLDKLAGILREEPQLSIAAEKRTDYITNPIIEELL